VIVRGVVDVLADLELAHLVEIAASNVQTTSVFVDLDYE
jgi:hypothetical protein